MMRLLLRTNQKLHLSDVSNVMVCEAPSHTLCKHKKKQLMYMILSATINIRLTPIRLGVIMLRVENAMVTLAYF